MSYTAREGAPPHRLRRAAPPSRYRTRCSPLHAHTQGAHRCTCTCTCTCDSTPVRAQAERAWGHGERVVAVLQHATRRCGGRVQACGVGRGWARQNWPAVPASHVADEACVSFCMCFGGKISERSRQKQVAESARSLVATCPSPRVSSFVCRESSSVYSRGMATMASMWPLLIGT